MKIKFSSLGLSIVLSFLAILAMLTLWQGDTGRADQPAPIPVPTVNPGGQPWFILVNTSTQVVSVYAQDGEGKYTRLLRQFPCSAGKRDGYTPKALYTLVGAKYRWISFPDWGGTYGQYATRIYGPFMFHSMEFTRMNDTTLQVETYLNLTRPASHGCIRMMPEHAKWIYDNCPKKCWVEVRLGEQDPDLTQSLQPPPPIDGKYLATMPPLFGETACYDTEPDWRLKGNKMP